MTDAFRKLSLGFRLVYFGLILTVLAVVVGLVGGIAIGVGAAAGRGGPAPGGGFGGPAAAGLGGGMLILLLVTTGLSLAGGLLGLVGKFRCLAVPESVPNARMMLMIAVGLELAGTLIGVVNNADQLGANFLPPLIKAGAGLLGSLFGVVAIVLFLLFIAAVARYIDRPDLAGSAMTVLKIDIALIVCLVLMIGAAVATIGGMAAGMGGPKGGGNQAAGAAALGGGLAMCGLGLVILVLAIVGLILYARLLSGMSTACARYADDPDTADRYADDDAAREYDDE